ncbi:MAG: circadian clock KaiB family protein [Candidatus Fermentibacterota bacterium]
MDSGRAYSLRLCVSGDSPSSRTALRNLNRLKSSLKEAELSVEMVDVSEEPQRALEADVFLTPTLQVVSPGPERLVFGDLSDLDGPMPLFEGRADER